ncbi:HEAT repeat domain-containing protein [Phenylobacterium deserti]|uniref:HEAT repeat domain-containing protein n=1 Tax=Phenylobacterium deserti TaxID=1914756 RepID=A0A328ADG8_9CAUL|nr:HEAT repeat domain-containing protein [Phenylobacterium deserti]RAK52547.1 hypothetical protein DJ018_10050 [Phenylobacterium deserti]
MALLTLIWLLALGMTFAALSWMSVLLAMRLWHDRRAARRAAARKSVEQALIALLLGKCDLQRDLGPFAGRARLMSECLLEFLSLVRGADRTLVLAAFDSLGVPATLRRRLTRGSAAGRRACIEALAAFPSPETEAALRQVVSSGAPQLRLAALKSIAEAGGHVPLGRVLADLKVGALPLSGLSGDFLRDRVAAEPGEAISALEDDLLPSTLRVLVLDALGSAGDYAALDILAAHVGAPDAEVRAAAVQALGRLKHPAARPHLARALQDPDSQVRAAAAEAVGDAGLDGLADDLCAGLEDAVWRVRFQAAAALRKLGAPGLQRLQHAAREASDVASRAASLALAEQGLPS